MNAPPRSILVVVTRRIGDVLLATPVIHSLHRAWPDAKIDALVFTGTEGVLAANPDLRRKLSAAAVQSVRALHVPWHREALFALPFNAWL